MAGTGPNGNTATRNAYNILADMNGDGVLDLIEYEQFASYFDIWFGLLDGGLGSRTTYDAGMTTYAAGIEYLAVGDVNGDGMPDLVVWDNCGALHRVLPYATDSGRMMHRTSVAGVELVS